IAVLLGLVRAAPLSAGAERDVSRIELGVQRGDLRVERRRDVCDGGRLLIDARVDAVRARRNALPAERFGAAVGAAVDRVDDDAVARRRSRGLLDREPRVLLR